MKTYMKTKNMPNSAGLEEHFAKKLQRLEKHVGRDVDAYINCTREKGLDRIEITLVGAGINLRAEDKGDDLYSALDTVIERLERQIERFKTRFEQKRTNRTSIRKAESGILPLEVVPQTVESNDEPHIVRNKRFQLNPMDPEEACMQMELLGHNFFVFLNAHTEVINVVYRRNDGNYGLIEPE